MLLQEGFGEGDCLVVWLNAQFFIEQIAQLLVVLVHLTLIAHLGVTEENRAVNIFAEGVGIQRAPVSPQRAPEVAPRVGALPQADQRLQVHLEESFAAVDHPFGVPRGQEVALVERHRPPPQVFGARVTDGQQPRLLGQAF